MAYIDTVRAEIGREPMRGPEAVKMAREIEAGMTALRDGYLETAERFIEEEEKRKEARTLKNWEEKRPVWLAQQNRAKREIAAAISLLGTFGSFQRVDGTRGYAFVSHVELDPDKPVTPSAQKFTLLTNDARYSVKIAGSQMEDFFKPTYYDLAEQWDETWDFNNVRHIVTGNLLRGLEHFGQSGSIIAYTTDTGESKMGILLPARFSKHKVDVDDSRQLVTKAGDLEEFLQNDVPVANDARTVLVDASRDQDGVLTITLMVPASRSIGGRFWRDPDLNRLMRGGEFEDRGGWMHGIIPPENVGAVYDRLAAMGERLFATPKKDEGNGRDDDAQGRKPPGAPVPDLPGDNRKRRLAPNGKPSNLNARQHAQVRTPQFKRYFGDWETLAKRNALESMPAISVDTSPFGSERNAKALRVVGSAEFDKLVSSHGTRAKAVINRTDGKRIIFARGQFGKPESHSADTRIMRLIPGLPDLLEAAVPLYETPEINPQKHPNIRGWHTYGSKAILDGQELYVQLTTFELHDGTEVLSEYHDHNVTWAEAMEKGQLAGPDPITNRAVTQADLSRNNLYQWWHSVNAETVSKVVDENGEPLVVWHGGTDADIFKASETTPSFFTPNYEDARRYARASTYRGQPGALRAFFLNIRNPREEPLFYDHKRGAGVARNAADGVIVAGGEGFAVWTPNQIKSATENSGEFSKENPSILGAPVPDPQGEDDESAIDDLLADLSSDLPSAAELRAMPKYHGQEQPGEFTVGDPARANYGTTEDVRRVANVLDEHYNQDVLEKQTNAETTRAAREMLSKDRDGVLRAHLEAFKEGRTIESAVMRKAGQILADQMWREAMASGDQKALDRASAMGLAYRATGSEIARALQVGRDPLMTPAERFGQFVREAIMDPQDVERQIDLEAAPKAAEKSRRIQQLEKELARAKADNKPVVAKAKSDELEALKKQPSKEQLALKTAKEQEARIKKLLAREGMTIGNLIGEDIGFRWKFGHTIAQMLGHGDAKREKAIDLIIHGFPTGEIARRTGYTKAEVLELNNELRSKPEGLRMALAKLVQQGADIAEAVRLVRENVLGAPAPGAGAQAPQISLEDALKQVDAMLDAYVPTAKQRDSGKWKKVERPKADKSPDAVLERVIKRLEKPRGPNAKPTELQELIKQHRKHRVSGFVQRAVDLGASEDVAQKADELIEAARNAKKEEEPDTQYAPFDPNDPVQVYLMQNKVSDSLGILGLVREYRTAMLLWGIKTHVVNTASNALSIAWNYLPQQFGESVVNLLTGNRIPDGHSFGDYPHYLRGLLNAATWRDALSMAWAGFAHEVDLVEHRYLGSELGDGELDRYGSQAAGGGVFRKTVRKSFALLKAMDVFAKTMIANMEVGSQAYKIGKALKLPPADLEKFITDQINEVGSISWVRAMDKATYLLFQKRGPAVKLLTRWLSLGGEAALKRLDNEAVALAKRAAYENTAAGRARLLAQANLSHLARGGLKFLQFVSAMQIPFIGTPTNIAAQTFRKSPLGIFRVAAKLMLATVAKARGKDWSSAYSPDEMQRDAVEQALAIGLTMLLASMVEGDDDDDKKKWIIIGGRPFKPGQGDKDFADAKHGGTYKIVHRDGSGKTLAEYSFGRLEPIGGVLATIVDGIRAYKMQWRARPKGQSGPETATSIAGNIVNSALHRQADQTFFHGINQMMRFVSNLSSGDYSKAMTGIPKSWASSMVPNLVRQALREMDDTVRNPKAESFWYDFLPLGSLAEPAIDAYGNEKKKADSPLWRVVAPATSDVVPTVPPKVGNMLSANERKNPLKPWFPARSDAGDYKLPLIGPNGKKTGERVMTDPEKTAYDTLRGKGWLRYMRGEAMPSAKQQTNPSEKDMERLKQLRTKAGQEAKKESC